MDAITFVPAARLSTAQKKQYLAMQHDFNKRAPNSGNVQLEPPSVLPNAFIAFVDGQMAGFVVYDFLFADPKTKTGKSLYLRRLYAAPEFEQKGVLPAMVSFMKKMGRTMKHPPQKVEWMRTKSGKEIEQKLMPKKTVPRH